MKKILKIFKILINIIIYFFIAVLAIYLLIVGYQKYIKKSNLIKINDYYLFQIASGSMEKNYHIGDCIVAKKQDDYKVGDVITYELDGFYITHRVHKIENDKIITKGDANKTLDDAINKKDIVGKVLFKLTILSFLIKYKYLIILVIIMLYILDNIIEKILKK